MHDIVRHYEPALFLIAFFSIIIGKTIADFRRR